MVKYNKANVKLSDRQLKKLKTAVKKKTGTTVRMSLKMLDGNDLPHELLLTTRQKAKLRNSHNGELHSNSWNLTFVNKLQFLEISMCSLTQ